MTNGNDSAYPSIDATGIMDGREGLTKRELFAAMAMQGFISADYTSENNISYVSEMSVKYADALMEQLKKTSL